MLNDRLIELFKIALDKNNVKQTQVVKIGIIYYLEENGLSQFGI